MTLSLKLINVSKSFSKKSILDNLNFSFHPGCYCILGPNGIGKTTILELLAGVQRQDSGTILLSDTNVLDSNSLEFKKRLCYIPSHSLFFPSVTGLEFLNFITSIKDVNDKQQVTAISELAKSFEIEKYLNNCFDSMSLGTQKKIFLTTLVIGNNQLIILDEPTNGLDVQSITILINLLTKMSKNVIIIIATHDHKFIDILNPKIIKLTSPIRTFN